jgi:hypothetical protein
MPNRLRVPGERAACGLADLGALRERRLRELLIAGLWRGLRGFFLVRLRCPLIH